MKLVAALLISLVLAGCGGGMVRPAVTNEPLTLHVEDHAPSTWDLPLGSVVPEQSNLVLHRQPSKAVGFSILFGPLGVVVANESAKSGTREHVSALDALRTLKVKDEAEKILAQLRDAGDLGPATLVSEAVPKGHFYLLQPYLLLEADRTASAQISVIVKIAEKNGRDDAWKGQYVRHVPWRMSLADLSNSDAAKVRDATLQALALTLRVMALDLAGKLPAGDTEVTMQPTGVLAWSILKELKGRKAGYLDDRYLLVRTNYGAGVPFLHGLHILDKDQVTLSGPNG